MKVPESTRLQEALHPSTDEHRLDQLVGDLDPAIRGAVARHPRLSAAAIERLAVDPASGVRARLAGRRHGHPPPASLAYDPHPAVRLEFARNPASGSTAADLAFDPWNAIRRAVAAHPAAARAVDPLLNDPDRRVRITLAGNCHLPDYALTRLLTDADAVVRFAALENPASPPDRIAVLRAATGRAWLEADIDNDAREFRFWPDERTWLAASGIWGRCLYATSPGLDPETMRALARDVDPLVRAAAARNSSLPLELEPALAADPDPRVRTAIAGRAAAAGLLERLAADPDLEVRGAVALNSRTPSGVLEVLRFDPVQEVRHRAFAHPNLAEASVDEMLEQGWPPRRRRKLSAAQWQVAIRNGWAELAAWYAPDSFVPALKTHPARVRYVLALRKDPALLIELSSDTSADVRAHVAENPLCPASVLEQLAVDPVLEVRAAVAAHPETPADARAVLARDLEPRVRWSVAMSRSVEPALLELLTDDPEASVVAHVAQHAAASEALRWRLAAHPAARVREALATAAREASLIERLAVDPEPRVRACLAGRADLPPALLLRLAVDPDPGVREKAAWNEALDEATRHVLAADVDRDVRTSALRRLAIDARARRRDGR